MNRAEATKLRDAIVLASESLPDETASEVPYLFPVWESGVGYSVGDRVRYGVLLYSCIQDHTSQDDWTPDVTQALWKRTSDPAEEWPEWIQPLGSEDAYHLGDKVSHNDKHWVSTADNNVWEPGVYGWEEAK